MIALLGALLIVVAALLVSSSRDEPESASLVLPRGVVVYQPAYRELTQAQLDLLRRSLGTRAVVERDPESACGRVGRLALVDGSVDEQERRALRAACPLDH